MIQCVAACERWFHLACVLTEGQELDAWECRNCDGDDEGEDDDDEQASNGLNGAADEAKVDPLKDLKSTGAVDGEGDSLTPRPELA